MSIYVETCIRGPFELLWRRTQQPSVHERWDARFTSIEYLPCPDASQPQQFRYTTRIGLGLHVCGEGESVVRHDPAARRSTSALRFWSRDPKSLIHEGAGYWQYVADGDAIRFITAYDYRTRWGWFGRLVDRFVFRPWIAWATAWSFDRLRLWIDKGIDPAVSLQRAMIHLLCRTSVALVWVYQGLVPKLLAADDSELTLLSEAGVSPAVASTVLPVIGWLEVTLGASTLILFWQRWTLFVTAWLMPLALIAVGLNSPASLTAAFNPVSLNLLMASVALIGLWSMRDLPSARNTLRTRPEIHHDAINLPTRVGN